MNTKQLIKRLGGFKDARANEFINEIIKRLEKHGELLRDAETIIKENEELREELRVYKSLYEDRLCYQEGK